MNISLKADFGCVGCRDVNMEAIIVGNFSLFSVAKKIEQLVDRLYFLLSNATTNLGIFRKYQT